MPISSSVLVSLFRLLRFGAAAAAAYVGCSVTVLLLWAYVAGGGGKV